MEFQPKLSENDIEKPPFLYHGTPQKNLDILHPNSKNFNGEVGNYVFASPDKKAAISYLAKGDYAWSAGIYNDEYFIVLPISREEFLKNDKGGAIYTFDSKNFKTSKARSEYEWVSTQEESPIQTEIFDSSLAAIENAGICVYFLDSEENYDKYYSKKQTGNKVAHDFLNEFRK